jgi:Uma2 family endonuclease
MSVLVLNPEVAARVLAEREAGGESTPDEVWDGVTVIMPDADIEHDDIAGFFYRTFWAVFGDNPANRVHFRVNLSDRVAGWRKNYRIPDTMVFLAGNPVRSYRTHYVGGPDIALEVVSPGDRSRDKLGFYASVGTREVIVIDRDPWRLELYQLSRGKLRLRATAAPGGAALSSVVAPLGFQLVRGRPRPKVRITHTESGQEWVG